MMVVRSSDVYRWTMSEIDRGDAQEKPGGMVLRLIRRVVVCPMRMLKIKMIGD